MLKNAAVGVAVVTHRGKKGRFIFFGKVPAHGDGHGIAQNDCRQKGKYQIAQKGVGTAPESQPFDARLSDHAGDCIEQDQKEEDLRQNLRDPQDELLRSRTDDILDSVGDEHGRPPYCEPDVKIHAFGQGSGHILFLRTIRISVLLFVSITYTPAG